MSLLKRYDLLTTLLLCLTIILYLVLRVLWLKKKRIETKVTREFALLLFVNYLFFLFVQTLLPTYHIITDGLAIKEIEFNFHHDLASANVIPFRSISYYLLGTNALVDDWFYVGVKNILGLICLYFPLGFFLPLLWTRFQSLKKFLPLELVTVTMIEIIQFLIGRSFDLDDIILSLLGSLLGFIGVRVLFHLKLLKEMKPASLL